MDETIHLLFDHHHAAGPVEVFRERSEDRVPVVAFLALPQGMYERMGQPEAIDMQLKRAL